jgi:hypothetical protein
MFGDYYLLADDHDPRWDGVFSASPSAASSRKSGCSPISHLPLTFR